MNVRGYVLVGQHRSADDSEALAVMTEWLAEDGDCRVFLNKQGAQVFVEMWRPER